MKSLVLLLIFIPVIIMGQETEKDSTCYCSEATLLKESENGLIIIEDRPVYPGNDTAFNEFLKTNIILDSTVNGKIWISFIINCKGIACGFEIQNIEGNISNDSEKKVISKLSEMKKWEPGKQRNKPADVPCKIIIEIRNGRVIL
jgi:hypothetical protein